MLIGSTKEDILDVPMLAFTPPAVFTQLSGYNNLVICDKSTGFWLFVKGLITDLEAESKLSGKYYGGGRGEAKLLNGEIVSIFNGANAYFEIPGNNKLEVVNTSILIIKTWMSPSVYDFPELENGLVISIKNTSSKYITEYTKNHRNGTLRDQDALSRYNIILSNIFVPMRVATLMKDSYFKGV